MTARKPKELHKKRGRPTALTETVLAKLLDGYSRGLNDNQACCYADVNPSTLYRYKAEHPDFQELIDKRKHHTAMQAVLNISDDIRRASIDTSKWYLERKAKDEYSLKSAADVSVNLGDGLTDKETALADYMVAFLGLDVE